MRVAAEFIGWAFFALSVAGAVIPGFNFHVAAAGDETALEWHRELAEKLAQRAQAQKEQSK